MIAAVFAGVGIFCLAAEMFILGAVLLGVAVLVLVR